MGSDTSEAPVEPTQDAADREVVGLAATEVATIDPLAAPADALPGGLYHVKTYDTGGGSVLEVFGTEQFERAMDPETGLSEELGPMIVVNRVGGGPAEALPSGRDASALTALSEELDAQVTISAVAEGEQSLIVDVKDGFIEFVGDGVDQSVLEAFALAMLDPYAEVG
ncbi:hypothetical protein [Cellulosimicrobium funkei]|uniref:hypothetical protein n=1 Tax=Cellulosimicrobium funkei TaxID=264251 RepID=UPI0036B8E2FD